VFETDVEALAWAAEKRLARVSQGWRPVDAGTAPERVF
jgi:hypothetical protein